MQNLILYRLALVSDGVIDQKMALVPQKNRLLSIQNLVFPADIRQWTCADALDSCAVCRI